MKNFKFYLKLIWAVFTNIDRKVFIVMDDSGSNSIYKIGFIKYSLHIMILFGIDVTIMQAGYKSNKKFVISENIDIINFMKNYQPNCGGTFLAESFKEIPKNSFVYIYSDFYLDRIDEECIDEFKNRFLVSKTDNTYSIYKNEINFL